VTIAIRPSDRGGIGKQIRLLLPPGEAKYFLQEGWTRRANQRHGIACDICTVMAALRPGHPRLWFSHFRKKQDVARMSASDMRDRKNNPDVAGAHPGYVAAAGRDEQISSGLTAANKARSTTVF
jgi:hypothetical protein